MKRQTIPGPDPAIRNQFSEWLGAIEGLKEANLVLQHRLAEEVRKAGGCRDRLEELEQFLDSLLNKDVHISLLKKDIRTQEAIALSGSAGKDFGTRQQRLQEDVTRMCGEFARLNADFERLFCVH